MPTTLMFLYNFFANLHYKIEKKRKEKLAIPKGYDSL
jgi:hypothetical protein